MTYKRIAIFFSLTMLLGVGGLYMTHKKGPAPIAQAPIVVSDAPDAKNATYKIESTMVTLKDGVFELNVEGTSATTTTTYFGNEVVGDLNGDGMSDVAFILTQSGGGSGTFYYVAVALKTETGYKGTNALLLGDRVAPQQTEIKNGVVIANYATRKEGEPMVTKPSVGVSLYAKIVNGALVQTSSQ